MVTVSGYAVRQNQQGEEFVVLILQGDLEMVRSQETGNFYATAKKCTITSTFSKQITTEMVGKQLPGRIVKEDCEAYDYLVPETGEIVEMSHRWTYVPEGEERKVKADIKTFSSNGIAVEA